MKNFTVYYEFLGNKYRTTVKADSVENAISKVKQMMIFTKIESELDESEDRLFNR